MYEGSPVAKFHELWSTNSLKPDRSFYPPSLFCFVPVAHPLWGINVAFHRDFRRNGIGFDCSSDLKQQKMLRETDPTVGLFTVSVFTLYAAVISEFIEVRWLVTETLYVAVL